DRTVRAGPTRASSGGSLRSRRDRSLRRFSDLLISMATSQSPSRHITTSRDLAGTSVIVAGAGLAGLTAAYDLASMGADVTVVDARERVGGRVWTIHEGFTDRQHAEAGGDMIEAEQKTIRELASSLDLKLTRILRGGFGYARADALGRPRLMK